MEKTLNKYTEFNFCEQAEFEQYLKDKKENRIEKYETNHISLFLTPMNLYFTTKNLTDNYGLLNTCNNILFVFGKKNPLYWVQTETTGQRFS